MAPEHLRIQYQDCSGRAERLREAVVVQLAELLRSHDVTLGVPIESRVKSWASIEEKLERKQLKLGAILELQDLVGVRAIVLFRQDLVQAIDLVRSNFDVVSAEDTSTRLGDAEFGYQSQHFVVRLPKAWLLLPSLANLNDFFVELQIRTLSQHIWAAASHKLQYKNETGVPRPLRRAINRVSALLETVDLEFDRVLDERRQYVEEVSSSPREREPLNVDNLAQLLADEFPAENKVAAEEYAELLSDLIKLDITDTTSLRTLIHSYREAVNVEEAERVKEIREGKGAAFDPEVVERVGRGVFYAHVGLARAALRAQFGDEQVDALHRARVANTKTSRRKRGG